MTATAQLPMFEDETVQQSQIRVVGAGDGLSEALKIDPKALHLGDEIFLVLRGSVTQVNHRQKEYGEPVVRVHTIQAGAVTEIEKKLAEKLLADAADALEKAKADAQGQLLLDGEEAAAAREARD